MLKQELCIQYNIGIGPLLFASVLQYNGLFMSLTVLLAVSAAVFFVSGKAKARG
ncbi:MAG: hypothetical protein ABSC20_06980 [Candidatus Bathyarchaeia archaeon]